MQKVIQRVIGGAAALLMALVPGGCTTPKNVALFQDSSPETIIRLAEAKPLRAKAGDKLMIVVKAKDAEVSGLFNNMAYSPLMDEQTRGSGSASVNVGSAGVAGYTVDKKGDIDFPVLGVLHIEGMTRAEIAAYIKGEIQGRDLVKDPTVTVEFLNQAVNVMGMVQKPGHYVLDKDEMTVIDMLSLAGDVSLQGQRENVKVLRREGNEVKTYVLDLTNAAQTMSSPAYYMQQDDIVYVEPNDMMKRNTTNNANNAMNVSFWISVASLLTTVATTVGVFVVK